MKGRPMVEINISISLATNRRRPVAGRKWNAPLLLLGQDTKTFRGRQNFHDNQMRVAWDMKNFWEVPERIRLDPMRLGIRLILML